MNEQTDVLRNYILNGLNYYISNASTAELPLDEISDAYVIVSKPSTISNHYPINIFIEQGEEEYSELSFTDYSVSMPVAIYILVRGDTSDNLYKKKFLYAACLKALISSDRTLGGYIDDIQSISFKPYDGVEGTKEMQAVEFKYNIKFQEGH